MYNRVMKLIKQIIPTSCPVKALIETNHGLTEKHVVCLAVAVEYNWLGAEGIPEVIPMVVDDYTGKIVLVCELTDGKYLRLAKNVEDK